MEKTLSESEIHIMRIIWNRGNTISSSELTSILESQSICWKRTTISTFISRLCKKGLLSSMKQGRIYSYTALMTEDEYCETQTKAFVQKMYKGNAKSLVASLVQNDFLSTEDIVELTKFWNEKVGDKDD